ncbi:MAG: hypothetical protein ACLQBD_32980 [Syntrophobacteraceae bacterium]
MALKIADTGYPARLLFGFIAGFAATLIFHQLTWWVLWGAGLAPSGPFSMEITKPFGVPAVFSHAFWGGIWGIAFSMADRRFPASSGYWVTAFLFGAVLPTMAGRLVAAPLKGVPMGSSWHLPLLLTAVLANGAWGIGTGLILRSQSGRLNRPRGTAA